MKKILVGLVLMTVGLWGQVQVSTPPPSGVQNVSVANVGVTGNTKYCYFVVTVHSRGMTPGSQFACTYNANDTMDGSNYNVVTWSTPAGGTPTGYWVVRTTGDTFPGTGTNAVNTTITANTVFTFSDQSTSTLHAWVFTPASYGNYQIAGQGGQQPVYSVEGNLTVAVLHLAPTIVLPIAGAKIKIVGFLLQAKGGAAATCTSVQVVDTTGTPVVGVQANAAQLTQDTVNDESAASMVLTTFLVNFVSGKGLVIRDVGGQCSTMTSLNYLVLYKVTP